MNTPDSDRPRLLCRVIRLWAALRGDDHATSATGLAGRHAAGCADCRAYFGTADAFENQLRREARTQIRPMPEGLDYQIIQAIRRTSAPARRRSPTLPILYALAGAAAVAVAAFLVVRQIVVPPRDDPSADIRMLVTMVQAVPGQLRQTVAPSAVELARRDPLRQELDSVYSDARSALNFLAANFLPADGDAFPSARRIVLPAQRT
jgi:hypothetical protein